MDYEKTDLYDLIQSEYNEARDELNKRLAAGEDVEVLFAAYTNEMAYLEEVGADPKLIQRMETKVLCAAVNMADQRMLESGWEYTDKDRYIRASNSPA